jgi:SAM-dependent methyltransferase
MKWSSAQTRAYWDSVHRHTAHDLAAVCHPASGLLHNGLSDYADRLGLEWALRRLGTLQGKRVLDLGTGRGRWPRRFTAAGATVTGLDVSFAALAAHGRPAWHRVVASADALPFRPASFDVVSSVTVIQHVPEEHHTTIFAEIQRVLKPGGRAVILERVGHDPLVHMMPRSAYDWVALANQHGLQFQGRRWTGYELAIRAYWRLRLPISRAVYAWQGLEMPSLVDPAPRREHLASSLDGVARELAAALSWPLEPVCFRLQPPLGTHMVYVFGKA